VPSRRRPSTPWFGPILRRAELRYPVTKVLIPGGGRCWIVTAGDTVGRAMEFPLNLSDESGAIN
jgi:hypothetical protein